MTSSTPPTTADAPDGIALIVACSRFSRTAALLAADHAGSVTWRLLATLDAAGPLRPSEIARRERTSRPAATEVIKRLAEEGLVRRRDDPDDARASLIEITDSGRDHLDHWRRQVGVGIEPVLAALSEVDRRTLLHATEILHRITDTTEGLLPPR